MSNSTDDLFKGMAMALNTAQTHTSVHAHAHATPSRPTNTSTHHSSTNSTPHQTPNTSTLKNRSQTPSTQSPRQNYSTQRPKTTPNSTSPRANYINASQQQPAQTPQSQISLRTDYVCSQQIFYTKKIDVEKKRILDVTKKLTRAKTAIAQRRKQLLGVSVVNNSGNKENTLSKTSVQSAPSEHKAVNRLENKLDLLIHKKNLYDITNLDLKHTVDNLRRDRLIQLSVSNKVNKEIRSKKIAVKALQDETNDMQDKRDKTQKEIEMIKVKIIAELNANDNEYNALKHELSIHSMGNINSKNNASVVHQADQNGSLTADEESTLISTINKTYWSIAKKKMDIQKQGLKISTLVDDFKYLCVSTGVESVSELEGVLIKSEESNFRLFHELNEFNMEVEEMELAKGELRSQLQHYNKIAKGQKDGKLKITRELEDQIDKAKTTKVKYDMRFATSMATLTAISPSILSMFNRVGCDNEALESTLLTAGITDRNVTMFMAVIESRIGEIVQLHQATKSKQNDSYTINYDGIVDNPTRPTTPSYDNKGRRMASLHAPTLPSYTDFEENDNDSDTDQVIEPMHISKLHDLVARDTRASRLGGGGKSKLNIGFKGKSSSVSLRSRGASKKSLGL